MGAVKQQAGLEIRGKGFALILVSSLLCAYLLQEKLSAWVVLSQVAIGIPLWFTALNYFLRKANHGDWWGFFLLIPLLRQMFFVLVPSVMTPFFGRYLLADYLPNVDLGVGILTLGNYVMFVSLALLMRSIRRKPASVAKVNHSLWVPAVLLIVFWLFFQLRASYVHGVSSSPGVALTRIWGYVGFVLLFGAVLRNAQTTFERRRAWSVIILALSLLIVPFLGLGGRQLVMEPVAVFAFAYLLFGRNRVRAWMYCVFIVLAVIGSVAAFLTTQGVRSRFYYTGARANVIDLKESFFNLNLASDYAYGTFHRFGANFNSTQFIASNPDFFPPWTIDRLAGVITDNMISSRILDLSELLGFDHSMVGFAPGAYLEIVIGRLGEGFAAFPPEAEFYLLAGFPGVVIGTAFMALLGVGWIAIFRRVFLDQLIAKAMTVGVIFPAYFYLEEMDKPISMLLWNCFILLVILAVCEKIFFVLRKTERSVLVTRKNLASVGFESGGTASHNARRSKAFL